MELKTEVLNMKKEINNLKDESMAMALIKQVKDMYNRLFFLFIIVLVLLGLSISYTVYLLNDIGTLTTETYSQDISDFETISNSTISNGD